ncbi:hypothetical protein E4U50_008144 [Claviceps purpurea]|nr:hypothetical protein E4U50_008144 [Claviceps purpurea]
MGHVIHAWRGGSAEDTYERSACGLHTSYAKTRCEIRIDAVREEAWQTWAMQAAVVREGELKNAVDTPTQYTDVAGAMVLP